MYFMWVHLLQQHELNYSTIIIKIEIPTKWEVKRYMRLWRVKEIQLGIDFKQNVSTQNSSRRKAIKKKYLSLCGLKELCGE